MIIFMCYHYYVHIISLKPHTIIIFFPTFPFIRIKKQQPSFLTPCPLQYMVWTIQRSWPCSFYLQNGDNIAIHSYCLEWLQRLQNSVVRSPLHFVLSTSTVLPSAGDGGEQPWGLSFTICPCLSWHCGPWVSSFTSLLSSSGKSQSWKK